MAELRLFSNLAKRQRALKYGVLCGQQNLKDFLLFIQIYLQSSITENGEKF